MTVSAINVMLPTRGRAKGRLANFLDSLASYTEDRGTVHVSLLTDEDDAETRDYLTARAPVYPIPLHVYVDKGGDGKPHLARYYNRLYDESLREHGPDMAVSMFGDDMEFRTVGWERHFLTALNAASGWALVYGDDCFRQHERMAVHFVTTPQVVSATGKPFMWEDWRANMIDWVWTEVARKAGILTYLPDVHIAHLHSSAHGADETYHRMDAYRVFATGREKVLWPYVDECVRGINERR